MTERIDQIRAEAEQAIAAATDTAALEDVRIRYLGRKAELPNLLRSVAELPPADGRSLIGRELGDAAQQVRQLGLAPEVADADVLERRRVPGGGDLPLGRGLDLGDAVERAHGVGRILDSS